MKFKAGDKVSFNDEFFGKRKGIVIDYKEPFMGFSYVRESYEYLVRFKVNKEILNGWFSEEELK